MPALGGPPDQYGYTYSRLLKLWKLQWESFSVLSFDQSRLESLKPHLKIVDSDRPAQIRLSIDDLSESKLKDWANMANYRRAWQTSVSNVQMLNLAVMGFFGVAVFHQSGFTTQSHRTIAGLVSRDRSTGVQSRNSVFDSWIFRHSTIRTNHRVAIV